MKSYNAFCDHYCLDPEDIDGRSRRQYDRYIEQLKVLGSEEEIELPVTPKDVGGRPRLSENEKKSKVVQVRFTEDDYQAIEKLAEKAGFKNVSHFIRSNINAWTRDQLTK